MSFVFVDHAGYSVNMSLNELDMVLVCDSQHRYHVD